MKIFSTLNCKDYDIMFIDEYLTSEELLYSVKTNRVVRDTENTVDSNSSTRIDSA